MQNEGSPSEPGAEAREEILYYTTCVLTGTARLPTTDGVNASTCRCVLGLPRVVHNRNSKKIVSTLKQGLKALVERYPSNWDESLSMILWSYRSCQMEGLTFLPFNFCLAENKIQQYRCCMTT